MRQSHVIDISRDYKFFYMDLEGGSMVYMATISERARDKNHGRHGKPSIDFWETMELPGTRKDCLLC